MSRDYHFSALKAALIPKENGKLRVICVPTVADRLVQRTIVNWLVDTKKFPHKEFVYGVKGEGLRRALDQALKTRRTNEWCVKTDIQAFFDNVRRDKLKTLISSRLRNSSVTSLLFMAIDREIRPKSITQRLAIDSAGIRTGIGIRQGMPLSSMLANISLSPFDAACKRSGMKMLRYADDILGLYSSKSEALAGLDCIKFALAKLELDVPELGSAKTELIGPRDPVTFLGREILYLDSASDYVCRVGRNKLSAIKANLLKEYSLKNVLVENSTISEAIGSLSASMRSYLGTYKDAHDFAHFNSEIRHHFKSITTGWFSELFGTDAIQKLSEDQKLFLGIQSTDALEPTDDLELAC
jgi:hypothetical protein